MARPGYIEARDRKYHAKESLEEAERNLAEVDKPGFLGPMPCPPSLIESHRADRQKLLDKYRAEYHAAEQAFAAFERKPKGRQFYDEHLQISLSVSEELGRAIREARKNGTSLADLTRQALMEHFGLVELPF